MFALIYSSFLITNNGVSFLECDAVAQVLLHKESNHSANMPKE